MRHLPWIGVQGHALSVYFFLEQAVGLKGLQLRLLLLQAFFKPQTREDRRCPRKGLLDHLDAS